MNTIDKIRAEIGKHLDALNKVKHLATFAEEHGYNHGFEDAMRDLLSFLDTLEEPVCHYGDVPSYERCVVCSANCSARVEEKSEKPINLEDAVKEYFHGMWPGMNTPEQCNTDLHFTPPAIMRLVKHFYELDRGRSEKPNNHLEDLDEAARWNAGLNFDREMECESFWHDVETFKAGAEWDRNQMMKEAVEGVVHYFGETQGVPRSITIPQMQKWLKPFGDGDKVRIIIVKEEEK